MIAAIFNHDEARKIAEDWIGAWNNRELDRIISRYADDVEFSSPTVMTHGVNPPEFYGEERNFENTSGAGSNFSAQMRGFNFWTFSPA